MARQILTQTVHSSVVPSHDNGLDKMLFFSKGGTRYPLEPELRKPHFIVTWLCYNCPLTGELLSWDACSRKLGGHWEASGVCHCFIS